VRNRFLEGKVAIVTGGGRGIGAATAADLARAGAMVTVAARTEEEIEAVVHQIGEAGGSALAVPTDIGDGEQVLAMVERTVEAFRRIDFLINCAAILEPLGRPAWEVTPEAWRRTIDVDLVGPFLLAHAVVPHMVRQRTGRVINVSSELTVPRASAYSAARAGANSFIRVLSAELLGTGVTANIVWPGVVETRSLHDFRWGLFGEDRSRMSSRWQLPAVDPAGPARMLVWLCSPATAHLTGQVVRWNDPLVHGQLAFFRAA
jgi:3-oxoacyl-[acyl-carrier protein] reductase